MITHDPLVAFLYLLVLEESARSTLDRADAACASATHALEVESLGVLAEDLAERLRGQGGAEAAYDRWIAAHPTAGGEEPGVGRESFLAGFKAACGVGR